MAILTGLNLTFFQEQFNLHKMGEMDKAPFLWKTFNKAGFVTGWAEDLGKWGTFTNDKAGLKNPPTNYYLRPFMLFAERVIGWNAKADRFGRNTSCIGYRHESDYIYQNMLDFVTQFQNDSFFGLFWGSSFSHDNWRDLSSMDLRLLHYLNEIEKRGILDSSAVIFLSDHGDRFGSLQKTSVSEIK
jgi:hypothetical protein